MKAKILVALQTFGKYSQKPVELLAQSGFDIAFNKLGHRLNAQEILALGAACDGIIAGVEPYHKKVLDGLVNLKCISRCGVGIDNIDLQETRKRGIAIFNTPEAVIQPVAEMAVAMIFALSRNLAQQTAYMKSGLWKGLPGRLLAGKKAGIIGLGRIGRRVAEILKKLDVEVLGLDLKPNTAWAHANGIELVTLEHILTYCDIITIHISVLEKHRFFLGEQEIRQLKDNALVINTSRGSVIDESALYAALRAGRLKGAALDVFSEEPYKGPLLELDNVILTPHISTLTEESRAAMEDNAVENILRFFKNKQPQKG